MSTGGGGRVGITGADGFVGRHLCRHFVSRGWEVNGLVRNPEHARVSGVRGVQYFDGDLPDHVDAEGLTRLDALIHCAYATRPSRSDPTHMTDRSAAARLRVACRDRGVGKFVFVSSLSAHEAAVSQYGRSKFHIEQELDLTKDLVLRLGLVVGPGERSLLSRMLVSLRRTRVVPVFDGGHQTLQTVFIGDVCDAAEHAISADMAGRLIIAEPQGLTVRQFFAEAAAVMGIRCRIVPLPAAPVLLALRLAERLPWALPVSSENVLGMRSLRYQPSSADLARLGVCARPAAESLALALGGGSHAPDP